jgi:hypothetical protein
MDRRLLRERSRTGDEDFALREMGIDGRMVAVCVQRDSEPRRRGEIGGWPVVARRAHELERRAEDGVEVVRRLPQKVDALAADCGAVLEQPEQPDESEERVAGIVRECRRERAERGVARDRDERAFECRPGVSVGKRPYC